MCRLPPEKTGRKKWDQSQKNATMIQTASRQPRSRYGNERKILRAMGIRQGALVRHTWWEATTAPRKDTTPQELSRSDLVALVSASKLSWQNSATQTFGGVECRELHVSAAWQQYPWLKNMPPLPSWCTDAVMFSLDLMAHLMECLILRDASVAAVCWHLEPRGGVAPSSATSPGVTRTLDLPRSISGVLAGWPRLVVMACRARLESRLWMTPSPVPREPQEKATRMGLCGVAPTSCTE